MYTILNALLPLLTAIPEIENDIADALKLHWTKSHVQQAMIGLEVLSKIAIDITNSWPPSLVTMPLAKVTVSGTGTVSGSVDGAQE